MASSAWNPIERPCDHIVLADKRSPGIAEIVGASSPRQWDEREGFGLSGAWLVYKGRGLARFSVRIKLLTVDDWNAWAAFRPLVDAYPKRRHASGKDSGALKIWHPYLEQLDIRAVAVLEVLQPVLSDDGEAIVEIRFLEYRHPKIALAKPGAADAGPEPDPIEENVIKPLVNQLKDLL